MGLDRRDATTGAYSMTFRSIGDVATTVVKDLADLRNPLLVGLLQKIPPVGDDWPKGQRVRWFRTFAMNVSQIYDTGDEVVNLVITTASPTLPGDHDR